MNTNNSQQIGHLAEQKACQYLQAHGLLLLQQNFRCHYGEIDLIMQDHDCIVFVEVRCRTHIDYGTALESINKYKMKALIKTATHFLQIKKWLYKVNSRFDVIAIHLKSGNMELEWFKNVFSVDG